jgi:hypothetical protein
VLVSLRICDKSIDLPKNNANLRNTKTPSNYDGFGERPPEHLCPATTEFMAQLEKIAVRQLATVLRLKEHRMGNAPLSQDELEAIVKECSVGEHESQALWEAFEAHRIEQGCRDMYVDVPDDESK